MVAAMPAAELQERILSLLRLEAPRPSAAEGLDDALARLECGGYLHHQWAGAGRLGELPAAWAAALSRAHRKTAIDNLTALSALRSIAPILQGETIPFLVLKGAAYLADLYDDPGSRALTDIDVLIRPADAGRLARTLARAGYQGESRGYEARYMRFEMWRPQAGEVRFEFHWWLGLPRRFRFAQDELWARSQTCRIDGGTFARLAPEDALIYHVAHQADHYFGPSLKWLVDLRQMCRRWSLDPSIVRERAAACGARVPLALAVQHLRRIFPDDVPEALRDLAARLGPARRGLLRHFLSRQPLAILDVPPQRSLSRYLLRLLLVDRARDVAALIGEGCLHPIGRGFDRLRGRQERPPWTWEPSSLKGSD